jgi:chitosanase
MDCMLTATQKSAAEAIVNIFETGRVLGHYGNVTLLKGDSGHLTYGRTQTTLTSGNLFLLINDYVNADGAEYADHFKPFLARLRAIDVSLDNDPIIKELLQQAGSDPVMHQVQDAFFDRVYWNPALVCATELGIVSALGCCTVYDSMVHGSWRMMRDRTNAQYGLCRTLGENIWIARYVSVRQQWLADNPNLLLRKTVYRMVELGKLIEANRWNLDLPIVVRGVTIDEATFAAAPVRASAQIVEDRLLSLGDPMLRGSDVEQVQNALNAKGYVLVVDGVFGAKTSAAVVDFQRKCGLHPDGIVGPATKAELGL